MKTKRVYKIYRGEIKKMMTTENELKAADAFRRSLVNTVYGRSATKHVDSAAEERNNYDERILFANRYFSLPDHVPNCCMDGLECLAYCSEDEQKKFEEAWKEHLL